MAVIYLEHKVHGTKVAVSEMEAEIDEKSGWRRFSHEERATASQQGKSAPQKKTVQEPAPI